MLRRPLSPLDTAQRLGGMFDLAAKAVNESEQMERIALAVYELEVTLVLQNAIRVRSSGKNETGEDFEIVVDRTRCKGRIDEVKRRAVGIGGRVRKLHTYL